MTEKFDIVLCYLPNNVLRPPLNISILKSCIQEQGYTCKCLDLNLSLWLHLNKTKSFFAKAATFESNMMWEDKDRFKQFYMETLENVMNKWVDDILSYKPKVIAFSLNFFRIKNVALKFAKIIKRKNPEQLLVFGGRLLDTTDFNKEFKGIVDYFVFGEGEEAIIEILKGNYNFQGINIPGKSISDCERTPYFDIRKSPHPDFSDFDFSLYPNDCYDDMNNNTGTPAVYFETSRSCVNHCKFCNVNYVFGPYREISADRVVERLVHMNKTYGIKKFLSADNLINGNLKRLTEIMNKLVDYYKENNIEPFQWNAEFICVSKEKLTSEWFDKLKASGASTICIGVESGSKRIRNHIGKYFTNDDLEYIISECNKRDICTRLMFFAGYFIETEEDFQETLDLVKRLAIYKDTIRPVYTGNTYRVAPHSRIKEEYFFKRKEIILDPRFKAMSPHLYWKYKDNDIFVRLRRHERLANLCEELGYETINPMKGYTKDIFEKYGDLE